MTRHSLPACLRGTSNWKSSLASFSAALCAPRDSDTNATISANSPEASPSVLGPQAASSATWSAALPSNFSCKYFSSTSAISSGFMAPPGFPCCRSASSSEMSSILGSIIFTERVAGPPPGPVGVVTDTCFRPGPGTRLSPAITTSSSSLTASPEVASSCRRRTRKASWSTGASASSASFAMTSWPKNASCSFWAEAANELAAR
mmetsp:Transcript_98598/g.170715  ORF Transcript_98598/g.170715 Transcript_98598/m.170715 type:complete len:204 (+) Transcript_98598:1957-2568(+)